jgi:squamous cell carcinoma antigen recognized by T-cells 3
LEEKDGILKIRKVMEEAVRSGGLHVSKGALLWDTYREVELATYKIIGKEDPDAHLNQAQIVSQLFQRQLSVPLLDMAGTWSEYEEWLQLTNQELEPHVKNTYEKALSLLEKLTPLETTLLSCSTPEEKLPVYKKYLEIEKKESKDPARIVALYERIVAELPLYETLWTDYCKFVDRQLKISDITFALFNRAVRNCPWSSSIWVEFIFAAERYEKGHTFIAGNKLKIVQLIRVSVYLKYF